MPVNPNTDSWKSVVGGDWDTASNWSSDPALPDSADTVVIATVGTVTITHSNNVGDIVSTLTTASTDNLSVSSGSLTVENTATLGGTVVLSGGNLVFNGTATLAGLAQTGGTLSGTGLVTVTGTASFGTSGDVQTGTGTTDLQAGGTIGTGTLYLDGGRILQNDATLTVNGGTIYLGYNGRGVTVGGATLNNSAGATLILENAASITYNSGTDTFTNAGTLQVSGTGTDFINGALNNTGDVQVDSGTLNLTTGGTSNTGTITVASGATMQFSSGTFTFNSGSYTASGATSVSGATVNFGVISVTMNGGLTVSSGTANLASATLGSLGNLLTLSGNGTLALGAHNLSIGLAQTGGTLSGTGLVTVTGTASFGTSGDVQTGTGTTDLQAGGTIGTGTLYLDGGRILQNDATLTVNGGTIYLGYNGRGVTVGGATLNNSAGATLILENAASITYNSGTDTFTNAGTLQVSGTGTDFINGALNNTGDVQVDSGTLNLTTGGTSNTGTITVASGATMQFSSGTFTFNSGSYTASGATSVSGATVNFGVISVTMNGGLTVSSGTANLASATLGSLGNLLTLSGNGTLALGAHNLSIGLAQTGGTLSGTGLVTVTGTASFGTSGDVQTGTGTTDLQAGGTIGTGTLYLDGGRILQNDATLTVNGGTIYLGYNGRGVTVGGATLNNSAGATLILENAASITYNSGTDTFTNAGTLQVSGTGTDFINGALNNTGDVQVDSGTLNLTTGGTSNTGTITVASGATMQFSSGTFTFNSGSYTASGATSVSGATVNFGVISVTMNGGLTVSSGTANLASATLGSLGNLLTLSGNGTLALGAHNLSIGLAQTGGTLSGTGLVTVTGTASFGTSGDVQTGTGTTDLQAGGTIGTGTLYLDGGRILQNDATLTVNGGTIYLGYNGRGVTVGGATLNNSAGATLILENAASITYNSGTDTFTNAGTLQVSGTGTDFINGALNNTGDVQVDSGTLSITNLSNFLGSTLSVGAYSVGTNATLQLGNNSSLVTLNAALTLTGSGSVFKSNGKQVDATLTTIGTTGALHLLSGRTLTTSNALSDSGLLELGGGTLTPSALTIATTGIFEGFGTLNAAIVNSGKIEAKGGTLTLQGAVTGSGTTKIDAGAALEVASAGAYAVTFAGENATLKLDNPSSFTGLISGLGQGDMIDLVGTTVVGNPVISGSTLTVNTTSGTLNFQISGALTGSSFNVRSDNSGGSILTLSVPNYVLAQGTVNTVSPINLGNERVGGTAAQAISIGNVAASPAESLDATISGVTGSASASGVVSLLAAGVTDASSITVGVNTASAGAKSGSVTLALASDGSNTDGLGTTALSTQTLQVTGTVFREAAPLAGALPAHFVVHVGDTVAQALSIADNIAADGYSENLQVGVSGTTGGVTAMPPASEITAGNSGGVTIGFSTANSGTVSGSAVLTFASDGTGIDGFGPTAIGTQQIQVNATVDNYAQAALEEVSGLGTWSGTAASGYTLNLGTLKQGDAPITVDLAALNAATGLADLLQGNFTVIGSSAFTNNGFDNFSGLGSGQSDTAPSVTFTTGTAGTFTETITLHSTGSNASGYCGALTDETLTIIGTVAPTLPVATIDTTSPIDLGGVRQGMTATAALSVTNTGNSSALGLDGSIASTQGAATGAGSFSLLASSANDNMDLAVGLDTSTAGSKSGSVTVTFSGDDGAGNLTALPSQTVNVTGKVYREASFAVGASNPIVHVGDTINQAITVFNNAASDGYSENLIGLLSIPSTGVSITNGDTGDVAAGKSNTLTVSYAATQAGLLSESATLDLESDGTGLDSAGPTTIGEQTVALNATVDNYATEALTASAGNLQFDGTNYTLDLGTISQHAAQSSISISIANNATGRADLLSGNITLESGGGFVNSGNTSFADLAAGQSAALENISIPTSTSGTFTEAFLVQTTGSNASGYSGALAPRTLTITADVEVPPPNLSVASASGSEDTPVMLSIAASLANAAPNQSLSILISGLPQGATLSAGTSLGDGSYLLTPAQLQGLAINPPDAFVGSFKLTAEATDTDSNSGETASTTQISSVTVNPVAVTPSLTVTAASGTEDTPIVLAVNAAQAESDLATANLTITISGLQGATLSAGFRNPDGSYTLQVAVLAGLTITPAASFTGTLVLNVTATDAEAATDTTASTAPEMLDVAVEPVVSPDLVITSVDAPVQAINGSPVQLSWTIENTGNATATGPWADNVYLASDAAGDDLQLVGTFEDGATLAPGRNTTVTQLLKLPSSGSGEQYFVVKTDVNHQVASLRIEGNPIGIAPDPTQVTTTIDWSALEASAQPPTIDGTDWSLIWDRFVDQVGPTVSSITNALSAASATLSSIGEPTSDEGTLIGYELENASGLLPNITLAQTTDLADSGAGLDLSLTRTYSASFLNRNNPGAFGDGWSFTYDVSAFTDSSGNVYIKSPTGIEIFTPNSDGYLGQAGDNSTLILKNGSYVLTDVSGTVETFVGASVLTLLGVPTEAELALSIAYEKLSSITDSNGNTIHVSYDQNDNGDITGITDSNGQSLSFTSNAQGSITSATDGEGRIVTYTYDVSGKHLLSVSGADGVTNYSYYSSGNGFLQNALAQITNPDGTTQSFQYDSKGDLVSQSGSGGADEVTYSYGSVGTVTETDASGNTTALVYDASGNLGETTDAAGNITKLQYNADGALTTLSAPTGSYSFTYDANSNLTGYTDANGGTVSATYLPGTNLLLSLTDQNGDTTSYSYDSVGDLTGISYDDGSGTKYDYSSSGVLTETINATGAAIQYGYNAAGLLASETFSDGTSLNYSYNSQGELTAAQARNGGITSYNYNAAGELTGVIDLNGRVESYSYNTAGQEIQRVEPDGSTTSYSYNSADELAELQDGKGNLLDKYTYDASGQLVRTDTGNGAATLYSYDRLGNVTQIQTLDTAGSITSQLDYTYDSNSRPVTETSFDGTWTYGYDANGELTSAVFASLNASIPNQDLTYEYDGAGNRTKTIINGAVTNYVTNGLNQYTSADGTVYSYDADGNLISLMGNGQTTTYSYDALNQLTFTTGPGGTTTYSYDALGNIVSTIVNGVETDYVIDPLAISTPSTGPLSAISQVYNSSETVTATYDYGVGLASETTNGNIYYYSTDATGNVIGLSGKNGDIVNEYDYMPFGVLIKSTNNVNNIFEFQGSLGIATESSSLINVRARYYDPSMGRFITIDPSGLHGSTNLYSYVNNDPLTGIDITGLWELFFFASNDLENPGPVRVGEEKVGLVGYNSDSGGYKGYINAITAHAGSEENYGGGATGIELLSNGEVTPIALAEGGIGGELPLVGGVGGGAGSYWNEAEQGVYFFLNVGILGDHVSIGFGFPISGIVNDLSNLLNLGVKKSAPVGFGSAPSRGSTAGALGCPHFTTFSGQNFDFQGAGEFVAVKATRLGDTFQVQLRIEPEGSPDSSVSIITQIAVQVGLNRVTFSVNRSNDTGVSADPGSDTADVVWVDGAPVSISQSNPVFTLKGGTITEVSANEYDVFLSTGEEMKINPYGDGMGFSVTLPQSDGANSVQGFLGPNNGVANDFELPDGTVLQEPLTQAELYQQFANAWRVTDATSLLDYALGQDTATFTDSQYPREILTLADLPPDLVASAAALVAAAGITDPTLAADAEFDYITMGDPSAITHDASVAGAFVEPTTQAVISDQVAPPPSIGVLPASPTVVESGSGTTPVTFYVELSRTAATDTVVNYTVVSGGSPSVGAGGSDYFTAADFGGTVPSGSVTIAAGQTFADVTVNVRASALGQAPDKWVQIELSSAGGDPLITRLAEAEVISNQPVAGIPAQPTIELLNGAGSSAAEYSMALTQVGDAYTLNLGNVVTNADLKNLEFSLANTAAPNSDSLASDISSLTGNGFQVTGSQPPAMVEAGSTFDGIYFQPQTNTVGNYSEIVTLSAADVNDSGYLATLPNITLTVEDTIIAPAQAGLGSTSVTFGNVRVGTTESQVVSIANTGQSGAANLDATVSPSAGVTASGSVSLLAPGSTAATPLTIGLDTENAGLIGGTVTVNQFSDLGNGVEVPALPDSKITVSGAVYREASITLSNPIVHVGDPGTAQLAVINTAASDGYSEGLLTSLIGSLGAIIASGDATGLIAAGALDDSTFSSSFSTATAGVLSSDVSFDVKTDGTGTSGLGTLDLGTTVLPFTVTVDNYAQATLEDLSGPGSFSKSGNNYALNLGTIAQGSTEHPISLGVLNSAVGPADNLNGSFEIVGDTPLTDGNLSFTNSGFDAFSKLAVGTADSMPTVSLDTSSTGAFEEQITLHSSGSNASGYAGALTDETLTITGTVLAAPTVTAPSEVTLDHTGTAALLLAVTPVYAGDSLSLTLSGLPPDASLTDSDGDTLTISNHNITFSQTQLTSGVLDGLTVHTSENAASLSVSATESGATPTASSVPETITMTVICFMAGTNIATPEGERSIETLKIGERALTSDGHIASIKWVGRQTVSTRFGDPLRILPIRIKAGALQENMPVRDLLVSADHALFFDGILIQAGAIVNGISIIREADVPTMFTYYHVELGTHALILAENVPAETFIDNVDRMNFDNWAEHEALYPDGQFIEELSYPRAKAFRQLPQATRSRLAARAESLYSPFKASNRACGPRSDFSMRERRVGSLRV